MELTIRDRNFGEIRGNISYIMRLLNKNPQKDFYLTQITDGENFIYKKETALEQHKIYVKNGIFYLSTQYQLDRFDVEAAKALKADVYIGYWYNQVKSKN